MGTFGVYEGRYCVRNSTIPDRSQVWLRTVLNSTYTARIEFYWACSCESGYDKFIFLVGNEERARISGPGPVSWTGAIFDLPTGTNYLEWRYEKDPGGVQGFDRVFVDRIIVRRYNSVLDSQMQQRVTTQSLEEWSQYFTHAEYWSGIFDTYGENTQVTFTSWTAWTNGQTIKVYVRSADNYFNPLSANPSWSSELNNGMAPTTLIRGRYLQYKVEFHTSGSTTPWITDVNFTYQPLPLRAYNFRGVALSSTSIKWEWTNRATYYIDGYRIYSSTRPYNKDGVYLVITSTSDGLLAELPPDATYWVEQNLQPNTQYSRYVVAYTTTIVVFGGNASRTSDNSDAPFTRCTLAMEPQVRAEKYKEKGSPPYYEFIDISTEVWYSKIQDEVYFKPNWFSFTSQITSGTGRVEYYKVIFSTTAVWNENEAFVWYPSSYTYPNQYVGSVSERPIMFTTATFNSDSWYLQVKSYNLENVTSNYQPLIIGPLKFKGCPTQITDLTAVRGKGEEGTVMLTWSAPSDDMDGGNLINAKYVIKYRTGVIIDTDAKFDSIVRVETSTGMVSGEIVVSTNNVVPGNQQTYIITGLVPGLTYWFAIRTIDEDGNKSPISTNNTNLLLTRSRASKVYRIIFITPSYTLYAGDPSTKIKVQLVDEDNDEINTKFGAECDLKTTSNRGSFSIDGVNFGASKLYIIQGMSRAEFYYLDENAGTPTITVDEVSAIEKWNGEQGWLSASQVHNILPGKAIAFRVIPKDGNYNAQIQVDEYVYIEAIDKLGNVSKDFEGVVVATTSFSGMAINPSILTFQSSDQGRKEAILRNYYFAGPSSVTVQEVVSQDYKRILFVDNSNGYIVGNKGMLKSTSDGGIRWFTKLYRDDVSKGLNSVAVNATTVVLCGKNGLVITSTDNFTTMSFTEQNITTEELKDVDFVTASTVVICGTSGKIFKSTDSGMAFSEITTGINNDLNSQVFVSTSIGYVCGSNGVVLKTIDCAESYIQLNTGTNADLYDIDFLDEQTGFICGGNSTLLKTSDGGSTFNTITVSNENISLYGVDFVNQQIGVVCGSSGKVFVTTNGNNFVDKSPPQAQAENFYTVKMFDSNRIIVAGSNGNLYFTQNRGDTWQKIVMYGGSPQNFLWNATIISSFVVLTENVIQGNIEVGKTNAVVKLWVSLAYPTPITTRINKISIEKTGTLEDQYISAVKIEGYGQGSFVNGVAEIALTSLPTIKATPTTFYILVDISKDAPLDTTLSLKFNFGCVGVQTGVQFGRNNLPLITPYLPVVPPVVNVYIVDIDTMVYLRTGRVQISQTPVNFLEQGDYAVVAKIGLKTDRSTSPFRKLRLSITGDNLRDEDIAQVSIYADSPFEASNFLTSAKFSGGVALLDFSDKNKRIDKDTTSYFYITVEVSPEASYTREGTQVNFSVIANITTSDFLLDYEGVNSISSLLTGITNQIRTPRVRIEAARDIVFIRPISDIIATIPASVYQSQRVIMLPLGVSVGKRGWGTASADWLKLVIDKDPTASDTYTRFDRTTNLMAELWYDTDSDGKLNTSVDRMVGEGSFTSNQAAILFSQPEKIAVQNLEGYATYFVCINVPKNAQPKEVLRVRISTTVSITLAGIDEVSPNNIPTYSPQVTIEDFPDKVEADLVSISEVETALYEENVPFARLDLLTYCDATLDKLILISEGTAEAVSTVKLVKIYLDDGDLRLDKTKDVVVATGTFSSIGRCELTFFNPDNKLKYEPILILDSKVRAFITVDFDENATAGKTFGIGIAPSAFIYNLPNSQGKLYKNGIEVGYFSSNRTLLLDKRTPTKPVIKPIVPLGYGIDTGQEVENVVYYTPQINQIKFNWSAEVKYGNIKAGYCGIASRKPLHSGDTPDIVNYKMSTNIGDFSISGLNLEHNRLYYLWVKAENADGNFARINYVPIFVDRTEPLQPSQPETNLSNEIFWINSEIIEDNESFVKDIVVEERRHQEYLWRPTKIISLPLQDLVRQINSNTLVRNNDIADKIVFSSRSHLSDDTLVVYKFITSTQTKQDVEPVNFRTLFARLGYKLENISIKLEQKFSMPQEKKFYYYRVKSKNIVGLYSLSSVISNAIYSFVPDSLIMEVTTFPNPCDVRKKNLMICYILGKDAEVKLRFFDLFGKQIGEKFIPYGSEVSKMGVNFFELTESRDFATGMYILLMEAKDKDGKTERKKWKFGIIR
ncbi:MAG: YCF48-related protein [Endomicrobia bacterium]|nr:YCF48-related protein [Endomicrobiia bacterium]